MKEVILICLIADLKDFEEFKDFCTFYGIFLKDKSFTQSRQKMKSKQHLARMYSLN